MFASISTVRAGVGLARLARGGQGTGGARWGAEIAVQAVFGEYRWFPPRSPAEQLNATSFRSVTVTATGAFPRPRTVSRTFTSPVVIARLAALVNSLPATPYPDVAAMSCVAGGTAYRLGFTPGVVIYAGGCGGSDAITVTGKEQPRLWDLGALTAAARQLLHLTT